MILINDFLEKLLNVGLYFHFFFSFFEDYIKEKQEKTTIDGSEKGGDKWMLDLKYHSA